MVVDEAVMGQTYSPPVFNGVKEPADSAVEMMRVLFRAARAAREMAHLIFFIRCPCAFEPGILLEPACSCMGDGSDSGSGFVRIQGFVHLYTAHSFTLVTEQIQLLMGWQ
jgi:hypothetical protein